MKFHVEDRSEPVPGRGHLVIECERGYKGQCRFSLGPEVVKGTWQWDGNKEAPTIRPSIDCQGGCKRHFVMTEGKI